MSKKARLFPPSVLAGDSKAFFEVLNDEPDMAAAVVGASYLDACLGSLLRSYMRKGETTEKLLDPLGGALGGMVDRAKVAYSFDIIPKNYFQDVCTIAEVRNLFAHHHTMHSFDDPEIIAACGKLESMDEILKAVGPMARMARGHYVLTTVLLSQSFLLSAMAKEKGATNSAASAILSADPPKND